jgi:hypothetical protein
MFRFFKRWLRRRNEEPRITTQQMEGIILNAQIRDQVRRQVIRQELAEERG